MRRPFVLSFVLATLCATAAVAAVPEQQRTLYHYAEKSWAVGTVRLEAKPLTFRDGKLLVFPSQITDLLWAPNATKPRNLMLVHEVQSNDGDKPFFEQGQEFFAPIQLLPEHSYWKDNLPTTRRHAVAGGRRYVFRGEDAAEARRILGPYLKATEVQGMTRWPAQLQAVADGLVSAVPTIREDSVSYLLVYPTLARDFPEGAVPRVRTYLEGTAPPAEKASLVDRLVKEKVTGVEPVLRELGQRNDATGAVAMIGLDQLGQGAPTERLIELSRSDDADVRLYAAAALGTRAGKDPAALGRAKEILEAPTPEPAAQTAVAQGMARTGGEPVVPVLAEEVRRGASGSRAAGEALGMIGGKSAEAALAKILLETRGEAALSAAYGLGNMRDCAKCYELLHEQHETHPDPHVRQLIGIVLAVPVEHKH